MIPLRDENARTKFPGVTLLIIAINIAVFIYQAFVGPAGFETYVKGMGLIPAELTGRMRAAGPFHLPPVFSLIAAMFMHGGFGHILGNMWFLWIFGDNIEDSVGHFRFLIFYLLTGVIASLTHVYMDPHSTVPLVGASGAIAGILGAYFILFPFHRIVTLIWIIFYVTTVRIPAAFYLAMWFGMQILYSQAGGNVAWWAHIGGFISGMVFIYPFLPSHRRS